jgi:hypothetical protein
MLFNNNIQSKNGINHWIPFTEKEVNARDNFESHFMTDFMAGKIKFGDNGNSLFNNEIKQQGKMLFSSESQDVLNKGKELWKYYHKFGDGNVNASLYDINEYFKGRSEKTRKVNNKSKDEKYNILIKDLRDSIKKLGNRIAEKVYDYGFLLK